MKGRESRRTPSADLLVCFPSRAHLTLIPKPIYSPVRPSEPSSSRRHRHHLKKTSTRRARTGGGGGGQGSPLLWAKGNPLGGGQEIAEPTSPKVTCAGQIKVRHRSSSACRNWQSVMEEIEGIRSKRKQRKSPSWTEALGFKKDILQFLTCLRTIRLNFRCFGSFPGAEMSSDEEEEDEEEEEDGGEIYHENQVGIEESEDNEGCSTVFSKWFMVLDEDQKDDWKLEERERKSKCGGGSEVESSVPPPPPNALLLMRCRSAPVQSWFEEREKEGCEKFEEERENENEYLKKVEEGKRKKKRESLAIVMRYDTDFHKLSSDIAKETWAVSGLKDQLPRSRSWKGW
ncbi:hypothetical protein Nepgr_001973 [Nepenthes gracilis]|uniref:Uncharacterized protein n=1 Tax=Nepenthes gracilis TaxID=150966 RepID=A0AAD3P5E8_NEPGR|nr:hypothetical protein Nepgr_001973 [Nepenthes gracilis]